jgi:hypothetical protein
MGSSLTRDQLLELVRQFVYSKDASEADLCRWLVEFEDAIDHPAGRDLILKTRGEINPEHIVDAAMAYVPLKLPPQGTSQ